MATPVNDDRGTRVIIGLVPAKYDEVQIDYVSDSVTTYTFILDGVTLGVVQLTNNTEGELINAKRIQ